MGLISVCGSGVGCRNVFDSKSLPVWKSESSCVGAEHDIDWRVCFRFLPAVGAADLRRGGTMWFGLASPSPRRATKTETDDSSRQRRSTANQQQQIKPSGAISRFGHKGINKQNKQVRSQQQPLQQQAVVQKQDEYNRGYLQNHARRLSQIKRKV